MPAVCRIDACVDADDAHNRGDGQRVISVPAQQRHGEIPDRTRHLKDENGKGERLYILLDLYAKRALERLATCYGVTQKAILESILRQAENAALDKAAEFPNGQADYYGGKLRIPLGQ